MKRITLIMTICLAIVYPSIVEAAKTSIDGSLVSIRVALETSGNSRLVRFFEPRGKRPFIQGNSQAPDQYYRLMEADEGLNYSITVEPKVYDEKYMVPIVVDNRDILRALPLPNNYTNSSFWIKNRAAYVFSKGGNCTIQGGRSASDRVRPFRFVNAADSYSARMFNDLRNPGTIVILVFREEHKNQELELHGRDLGTTYDNEEIYSPTREVEFSPKKIAYEMFVIKYVSRATLRQEGYLPSTSAPSSDDVWGESDGQRYMPFD